MEQLIRQVGHWKLTHAQLRDGSTLVDEKFTVSHPTREPEYFNTQAEAEARFDNLLAAE
jgi:hypothetical protein